MAAHEPLAPGSPLQRAALLLLAGLLGGCSDPGGAEPPPPPRSVGELTPVQLYEAVDPFIATGGIGFNVGSAYPGPALPFAMIHPGPDTRGPTSPGPEFYHCSGYYWEDAHIGGFSLTRMHGTGVPDYGNIAFMPVDGMSEARCDENGYRAGFSHDAETAAPGYYQVLLDPGIEVEITSTLRAALFRIRFPGGVDPVLLVDAEHTLSGAVSSAEVTVDGFSGALGVRAHNNGGLSSRFGGFDVFAAAEVDTAPVEIGVWDDSGLWPGETAAGGVDVGAWLRFAPGTETIHLRVGLSFVDEAGAAANLAAEIGGFDFDQIRTAAEQTWRSELSALELSLYDNGEPAVAEQNERETTMLATALYHALLMPALMSDVDGRVRNALGEIVTTAGPRYSDFSLWDTYRTLHPWLLLTEDAHNEHFAASLIAMAEEGGAVPVWTLGHGDAHCMIGSPGEIVLAESALKGVPLADEERAYELSLVAAQGPSPGPVGGRGGIEDYLAYGYVPADLHSGAVSMTQEYAIADGALASWARRLGRDAEADELAAHADYWRNLYDPGVGFFRGKKADGDWVSWPGELTAADEYVEGNAYQYLWLVPHDPAGLAEVLGGSAAALGRLRSFFEQSAAEQPVLGLFKYYWHGNEPDIVAPWLFAAWGSPAETARWVSWVVATKYGVGPDGLAGNDDGGTLSAWLLLAGAGLYPVAGSDRYIVGAPRYPRLTLQRPSGALRIEAEPDPQRYPAPLAVTLDGEPLSGPTISHAELTGDHVLRFTMGPL